MSEMIERVSTVVREVLADIGGEWGSSEVDRIVRGAISAMREPTDAMIQAGDNVESAVSFVFVAADVWRAMVAEAMK